MSILYSLGIFEVLRFLTKYALIIWPVSVFVDFCLSVIFVSTNSRWAKIRWFPRILHSLAFGAGVMLIGVEFFWLEIVNIHYHGGREKFIIGPLVIYICVRLSQHFDIKYVLCDRRNKFHSVICFLLPLIILSITMIAGFNSITNSFSKIINIELITVFFIVPPLTLITLGSLSRCQISRSKLFFYGSLTTLFVLLLIICFVGADFKILGFLPWGRTNDDLWFIIFVAFMASTILFGSSLLKYHFVEKKAATEERHATEGMGNEK